MITSYFLCGSNVEVVSKTNLLLFIDGYSGYNHIVVNLEYLEKTFFTWSFGAFAYRRMLFGFCNAPTRKVYVNHLCLSN